MPIALGIAAQDLRQRLKLSIRDAALELGVSYAHLCNVENGKASPSPEMIDKFYEAWGIDLYMFAIAFHPSGRDIPSGLRGATTTLAKAWKKHIEVLIKQRVTEGEESCLTLES
jgi:transcriptional regulator with XRE-family HTH domain